MRSPSRSEGQERVIEGRAAQLEVGELDARRIARPHRLGEGCRAAGCRHGRGARVGIHRHLGAEGVAERPRDLVDQSGVRGRRDHPVAADRALQLGRRPFGDDASGIHHRDAAASWSASSRYCVVSSTVVPAADLAHRPPHLATAAGIETGRRLVEEQHGRVTQGERRCRVAAASRPSTARDLASPRPRGRSARAARRRGLGHRPRRGRTGARTSPGSAARRAARRRRSPVRRDRWRSAPTPRPSGRRDPRPSAWPSSPRVSVVNVCTTVLLPAPLAPSRPWSPADLQIEAVESVRGAVSLSQLTRLENGNRIHLAPLPYAVRGSVRD